MESSANGSPIFTGDFRHALDAKKRITIPSAWRATDSDLFLVLPHPNNTAFLLAVPPAEFRQLRDSVEAKAGISDAERRVFKTMLSSSAKNCWTDKQGRMVLPEEQCREVGLKTEVILVGSLERIEIWDPEQWLTHRAASQSTYRKVADAIGL